MVRAKRNATNARGGALECPFDATTRHRFTPIGSRSRVGYGASSPYLGGANFDQRSNTYIYLNEGSEVKYLKVRVVSVKLTK